MSSSVRRWIEALTAFAVGALGLGMIIGAFGFSELRMSVVAGPAVFPYMIGSGLVVIAAGLAVELARGRSALPEAVSGEQIAGSTGYRGVLPILIATVAFVATIRWAGLVISGTMLYLGVAIGFGSSRWLRDTLVGVAIAAITYFVFNGILGLRLPGGPFEYILAR